MKALLGASVVLLAVGCTPDLTEVPVNTPAKLHVRVRVTQLVEATDTIRVLASFDPGTDADGNVRSSPDDRLRFGDARYAPQGEEPPGPRHYDFSLEADSLPIGDVALFPPTVEGLPGQPGPIRLPYRFRSGPEVLIVETGSVVSLHTEMTSNASGLQEGDTWRIDFRRGSQAPLLGSVSGKGQPPDSLAIPTTWFDDGSSAPITATMLSSGKVAGSFAPGVYEYSVRWHSRIDWSVEVTQEEKNSPETTASSRLPRVPTVPRTPHR